MSMKSRIKFRSSLHDDFDYQYVCPVCGFLNNKVAEVEKHIGDNCVCNCFALNYSFCSKCDMELQVGTEIEGIDPKTWDNYSNEEIMKLANEHGVGTFIYAPNCYPKPRNAAV